MIKHVENPSIEVHNLTVIYHRKPVLWNIDFTLPQGELIGLMGPNGAGKSTLLKAILGLLPVQSGYAHIWGKPIQDVRQRVSYIPQRLSIDWDFPATVMDIALMGRYPGLGMFGRITRKDRDEASLALEKTGMLSYASRQISGLSGGQQQRVFIARALAQEADLYIMDEPFAGVDAATEAQIMDILRQMQNAGKTIVVVHHDLHSARDYFQWMILINASLMASGRTKEVMTEALLRQTYSGKLTLLSRVGDELRNKNYPVRES